MFLAMLMHNADPINVKSCWLHALNKINEILTFIRLTVLHPNYVFISYIRLELLVFV